FFTVGIFTVGVFTVVNSLMVYSLMVTVLVYRRFLFRWEKDDVRLPVGVQPQALVHDERVVDREGLHSAEATAPFLQHRLGGLRGGGVVHGLEVDVQVLPAHLLTGEVPLDLGELQRVLRGVGDVGH